jgi:tyrosine-protein phosphatase SIW14
MLRFRTPRFLASLNVFALLLVPTLLIAEQLPTTKDIPRFLKVAGGLYRGGQPVNGGFEFLKKQGVKTIINLREENDEESAVRGLGMNYIHLPMDVDPFTRSTVPETAIQKYFEILSNPENLPVFIHCKRGADRTGTMVGLFRIAVQGWDAKRAYTEARDVGMRWWYPGLKNQLYNFKPDMKYAIKTPTLATSN